MRNYQFERQTWRIEELAKAGIILAVDATDDEEAGNRIYIIQHLFETIAETANKLAADLEMDGRAAAA